MNRTLCWAPEAWEQYLYWQRTDSKVLAKINTLLRECARTPFAGTGKPEPLKGNAYKGYWSRRITQEHRLIYKAEGDNLRIAQCGEHYGDK